jgi:hypothetical protein
MSEEIDVQAFVHDLSDKYLACRRLGHQWRHHDVRRDSSGFTEVLRCSSCFTRRIDELSLHGHVLGRRYQHADGYLATNVTGGVAGSRDLFRLEALTRLVAKVEQKQGPKGLKAVS